MRRKQTIDQQTFNYEIGTLLFRVRTGNSAIILDLKDTDRQRFGDATEARRMYKIFEEGRTVWKHDVQIRAEYQVAKIS